MTSKIKGIFYCFAALLVVGLLFAGCNSTPEKKEEKKEKKKPSSFLKNSEGQTTPGKTSVEHDMLSHPKKKYGRTDEAKKILPKYGQDSKENHLSTRPSKNQLPFDLSSRKKIKVGLNFSGTAVTDIIPVFAGMLKFNYLIDNGVSGNVTIVLNAHMTSAEIWSIFQQILSISGAYYSVDGKVLKIRPHEAITQASSFDAESDIEVGMFYLRNASSKDIISQINPFLSKGVKPIELSSQNAILIVDTKNTIKKVRNLIGHLDKPSKFNWHKMIIPCHNVSSGRIVKELSEILPVLGFPVTTNLEKPLQGAIQLSNIDRLQIIVASSANQESLDELRRWASILDKTDVGEQERVFIYGVVNGKADELVQALSVIFPVEGTTLSANKAGAGSNTKASTKTTGSSKNPFSKKSKTPDGPASVFEMPVKIFADAVHNRLVVRTTPRTYAMMKAVLERLDTVPAQVLLQVLVVEINLTDSTQFGMEFSMKGSGNGTDKIFGTNYKELVPTGTGDNAQYGSKFWIFNPNNPEQKFGYIKALAGKNNVKVISSPQVLVVSHTEAKISVGNKVPLVSSEITNTQSTVKVSDEASTNLVRNIQYQDTGIILKVTPHVTRGGLITIDMDQTVSEAITNTTSQIDSPEIQERILQTSMSIRNGQTIICGGLIKEKVSDNLDTVPFIDSIPFLRRLLGNSNIEKRRTEMLILITGNIITKDTKLQELLKRYRQSVNTLRDFHDSNINGKPTKDKRKTGLWNSWFFE